MGASTFMRAAAAALAMHHVAFAQQCYYPNGANAPAEEKPCSSADGSACCPETWQCMDNGLCYNPSAKIYGRYSCTDKDWTSPGCPSNLCTYERTASGAEGIAQCSNHDNQWCCDADRTHVDCCQESPEPRPFFKLQDPKAYGTAGGRTGSSAPNLASITGKADGGESAPPSSTAPPTTSASKTKTTSSSESSRESVTSVQTTISSGTAGVVTFISTVLLTPTGSPANTDTPAPSSQSNSKVPVIVGCAVGIPLFLALLGILIWLFRKRSHQKRVPPYSETPDPYLNGTASPEFAGGAKLHKKSATTYESTNPGVPELGGGQGVGPERPISLIPGKAEMDSGGGFAPGTTPEAPHLVGIGGGNGRSPQTSWGSAPPEYRPDHTPEAYRHNQQPSIDGAMGAVTASPQTNGGRYIPYRPPASSYAPLGLNNVPEVAELPAVTTPPETAGPTQGSYAPAGYVELGDPSPPARMEHPEMRQLGAHGPGHGQGQ